MTALDRTDATAFLSRLVYWLSLMAREDYVEAGVEPREAYAQLRAHNERLIVLGGQLRKFGGDTGFGYPPEAFLDALSAKPDGNRATLTRALEKALAESI